MTFKVQSTSASGVQSQWKTHAGAFAHEIPVAIPPEFQGPGTGLSPEDLYAMALQNCFVATFKVFAEKSRLAFDLIQIDSTLFVDRNEKGQPWMARIDMKVHLKTSEPQDKARSLLERTSQSCMILNSVNTQKTFDFEIVS